MILSAFDTQWSDYLSCYVVTDYKLHRQTKLGIYLLVSTSVCVYGMETNKAVLTNFCKLNLTSQSHTQF